MYGWHAKKYANKVGMMHESKSQHIGKAPSQRKWPLSSGFALGLASVYCHKSLAPVL